MTLQNLFIWIHCKNQAWWRRARPECSNFYKLFSLWCFKTPRNLTGEQQNVVFLFFFWSQNFFDRWLHLLAHYAWLKGTTHNLLTLQSHFKQSESPTHMLSRWACSKVVLFSKRELYDCILSTHVTTQPGLALHYLHSVAGLLETFVQLHFNTNI